MVAARDRAVAAFLDLDTRQRYIADAVAAVRTLEPASRVPARWEHVAGTCFDATSHYLATSTRFELEDSAGNPLQTPAQPAVAEFHRAQTVLATAAAEVDRFYDEFRTELDSARSALAATPRIAQQAVDGANSIRAVIDSKPTVTGYPSVRALAGELNTVTAALDGALAANDPRGVRAAATRIHELAGRAPDVVASALDAGRRASAGVASVRTRIDAVQRRIEELPAVRSALLREFSEPNSADLVGNPARAAAELEAGRDLWRRASEALRTATPEDALGLISDARARLAAATEAAEQLGDRLTALREARDSPGAAEGRTRFRIRDAQLLVVDRGLTGQWGSVLDAQSRRVEVAAAGLQGVHPNFHAYLRELQAVEEFVKGVVERIRRDADSTSSREQAPSGSAQGGSPRGRSQQGRSP